jgi:hypothetical protein
VKRMIRILAVAVLVAVILVASLSPALARPRNFGQNLGTKDHPACDDTHRQPHNYERGAHHVVEPRDPDPPPGEPEQKVGCWVVLPSHQG